MKKLGLFIITMLFIFLLVGCNNQYDWEPSVGTSTNTESLTDLVSIYNDPSATSVTVLPVENLREDFIFGVDISTVIEVYDKGGKYYDKDGNEKDLFLILKEAGVNYIRIRLWVDPYDEDGKSYGGGTNDLEKAVKIASHAKSLELGVCLDFHYSDFWADPESQEMPKAWADLTYSQLVQKVYDYTFETLEVFKKNKATPDYVQLGNEINSGMLFEFGKITVQPTSWTRLTDLLKSANKAVKDFSPAIKTIIHLADGATFAKFDNFFSQMKNKSVEYDIIGLSYYPYWHGTISEFKDNMDRISAKYEKPVMVMEIAYGFTNVDPSQVNSNYSASNIYNETNEVNGGYKTSIQGQASFLRDVFNAISEVPNNMGLGAFYWEPAWLPVKGVGWATIASGRTNEEGKSTWANQALFSYSGKALPSLYILDLIKNAPNNTQISILLGSVETTLNVTLNLSLNEKLPDSTIGINTLHQYTTTAITWNQAEIDAITKQGSYTVTGTLVADNTVTITANVTAVENYIINPGLENRGTSDQEVVAPWYRDDAEGVKTNHTDPRTGKGHVNVWHSAAFDYNIYQDVVLPAGTYEFSFWAMGNADTQPTILLYVANALTTTDIVVSDNCAVIGWPNYKQFTISFTLTETTTVRVGVRGEGIADNWAHFDDFILARKEN